MNEIFFHFIETKTPFVLAKFAMSLDGKIACASGDSKWVSSEETRTEVHLLRKYYSGIMVGIGTVLAERIILYREENGAFASIVDITRVPGIGSGIYGKICTKITVE